jgi:UDP-GlcNAc3NAcA epimerase
VKKKILTVIGARPQFIKAWPVGNAFARLADDLEEVVVHTGQHYDTNMSDTFFHSLKMPTPKHQLNVGSGGHGYQVGTIMQRLEPVCDDEKPDVVLVYGDTNSTIAAAQVAAKAGIPLAHVEAGLRSFRPAMVEEVNRIVTDRLSTLLFCPTQTAVDNLLHEGRQKGVLLTGDVMLDAFLKIKPNLDRSGLRTMYALGECDFVLATVHRAESTDDPYVLSQIMAALRGISEQQIVVLPMHPRTKAALARSDVSLGNIRVIPPLGYAEMMAALAEASLVVTDSGGLQKEAFFAQCPCITIREETEWVETLTGGWNRVAGTTTDAIIDQYKAILSASPQGAIPDVFGNGDASDLIAAALVAM